MSRPADLEELCVLQQGLASLRPLPWSPPSEVAVGGVFVCFGRGGEGPGARGDEGWAAAVVMRGRRMLAAHLTRGEAGAPYAPGFLAAREGPLLEAAVAGLERLPDVLLVNATGRDHPRRAGLATHLGWCLDLPTVGVTHRTLVAEGDAPDDVTGARTPLFHEGEQVGWWLRTRRGARPVAVTPGWRIDLPDVCDVVLEVTRVRTPEPLRQARRLARTARPGIRPAA